jgi:hypothetical protein
VTEVSGRGKGATKRAKRKHQPEKAKEPLSLHPLTIEEAIRAALKTGRAPSPMANLANRQRKKRSKPA